MPGARAAILSSRLQFTACAYICCLTNNNVRQQMPVRKIERHQCCDRGESESSLVPLISPPPPPSHSHLLARLQAAINCHATRGHWRRSIFATAASQFPLPPIRSGATCALEVVREEVPASGAPNWRGPARVIFLAEFSFGVAHTPFLFNDAAAAPAAANVARP